MNFKKLLPVALLTVGMLVGCGPKVNGEVAITNKEALTAEYRIGDVDRQLGVAIKKDGVEQNALEAMLDGSLIIESSNIEVVTVSGTLIHAVSAGQATISVKYLGATDYVELTVLAKLTNKDKFGTVHEGTLADPFNNEDAVKVGHWVKDNGLTASLEEYYVKGTVASFYHTPGSRTDGAVSWYLTPAAADGEKFEVYKCYKADSSALTDDDVWVGAETVAHGIITFYGSQMEFSTSVLDSVSGTKPQPRKTIDSTFANALAAGKALTDGDATWDYYKFEAYVTSKDANGNYFLTATKGEDLSAEGALKEKSIELYNPADEIAALLLKDAKVRVTMNIKNYHGQIENDLKPTVEVIEAGTAWDKPVATAKTVTEALAIAAELADPEAGASTTGKDTYAITGYVVKKDKWSTGTNSSGTPYSNGNFYIADDKTETDTSKMIQVFRVNDQTKFDSLVIGETQVTVTSAIVKFKNKKSGAIIIETTQNPEYEIKNGGGTVTPPTPTKEPKVVDTPEVGKQYYWGMFQGNLNKTLFITGAMNGYYAATTEDVAAAAKVEIVAVEGGYNLKATLPDGTVKFVNAAVSGTHVNVSFGDTASSVYTFNTEYKTLVTKATVKGVEGEYSMGTRNDQSYNTVGFNAAKYLATNFVCNFYTVA